MMFHKLAAAAILMTFSVADSSQAPPMDPAAHHPPVAADASGKPMMAADGNMEELRGLLDKAEHAKNAKERENFLAQHLAAMRKQLDALNSQQCPMEKMGAGGMSPGMAADTPGAAKPGMMDGGMKGGGMKEGGMMMCHEMMKARMDSLTELLAQTWRREELRQRSR